MKLILAPGLAYGGYNVASFASPEIQAFVAVVMFIILAAALSSKVSTEVDDKYSKEI